LVAETDAGVVGMAILSDTFIGQLMEMPAVQVTHLVVAEGQRRRGVGRALLSGAVTWAEEVGADEIVASVLPSLREANRFYARLGFAPLVTRRVVPVAALRRNLALADPRGVRPRRRSPLSVGGGLGLRSRLAYGDAEPVIVLPD
jgi:ribosomal protein S18 acetylase RimI-like enzyme